MMIIKLIQKQEEKKKKNGLPVGTKVNAHVWDQREDEGKRLKNVHPFVETKYVF